VSGKSYISSENILCWNLVHYITKRTWSELEFDIFQSQKLIIGTYINCSMF